MDLENPEKGWNHKFCTVNGVRYHYVDQGRGPLTILLLHGFPDIWWGWRYIIKDLARDFRIICPDMIGYGQTDAPVELKRYGFESVSRDLVELMEAAGCKTKFLVLCHDWGVILIAFDLFRVWQDGDFPNIILKKY
jgi:soluble epoxide hydrolase/lipid-phosphate phosphatase